MHRRRRLFRRQGTCGSGTNRGGDRLLPEGKLHRRLPEASGNRPERSLQRGSFPHARRHRRVKAQLCGRAAELSAGARPEPA